jgi:hypothetical protein
MSGRNRMLPQLAKTARCARKNAGATTHEIAHDAHVDPSTVRRFERARAWPSDPDALITAYARHTNRKPKEIWRDALDRWNRT